jgi:negative regulator of sigma E activity
MKNNHITDEILQAYLLNEIQDDNIASHLTACSSCQKKLEEYQLFIDSVQKIKPETFSFDVTSIVMAKINEVERQKEKDTNIVLYMSFSIVSIVAMVLLYPYLKIIFTQFKSFSIMANVFMLVSVLGVVIFLLNDLFRQYKQKEMLLSQ